MELTTMPSSSGKVFSGASLFDPSGGHTVRVPAGDGAGWWAGAPTVTYDDQTGQFFMVYRMRRPRELGRGVELRIAASDNGVAFDDIWALPKATIGTLSIERSCLVRCADGGWRLFISHVDAGDLRWRISSLDAPEPDGFAVGSPEAVFTPDSTGTDGIKDPNVYRFGPVFYMLASIAVKVPGLTPEAETSRHETGDVFNTGLIASRTGIATSLDGRKFDWLGEAVMHGTGPDTAEWDTYCRRVTSVIALPAAGFLAFYDGSRDVAQNYEETTGLAHTADLVNYTRLTRTGPALQSPHSTGSLRYVDALTIGREQFYYFEVARPDGSHELRVVVEEV